MNPRVAPVAQAAATEPSSEIPWTKPDDVKLEPRLPALAEKGSFATPHQVDGKQAGVFLWADGSVSTIQSDTELPLLMKLFTIADGDIVRQAGRLPPGISSQIGSVRINAASVIEIIRDKNGPKARLKLR